LTENLHGVDLDAQAVEVAKLISGFLHGGGARCHARDAAGAKKGRSAALNLLPRLVKNFKRGTRSLMTKLWQAKAAFIGKSNFLKS